MGEIVAVVIARTEAMALDALELINVDYRALPAVVDVRDAALEARLSCSETVTSALKPHGAISTVVKEALAHAKHIVRTSLYNHRVYGCPLEPRAALAAFDPDEQRFTLYAPSQGVHRYKRSLAALAVPANAVRVVTGDVGGGFGLRIPCANEYPLILWAARRLAQPIMWTSSSTESLLADVHGRDVHCDAALALDDNGRFTALELNYVGNVGAHPISFCRLVKSTKNGWAPLRYSLDSRIRARGLHKYGPHFGLSRRRSAGSKPPR